MAKAEPSPSTPGPTRIVVFWIRRESRCAECGETLSPGGLITLRESTALCLDCADLGHLVFLPRGDATLTRRAGKHSGLRAVVVQWSRTSKRYERQGTLVEESALQRAEEECEQDADRRARSRFRAALQREAADSRYVEEFARGVRKRYPGCPEGTDLEIAEHACQKHSGRVGRTALAKSLDTGAIDLAVRAHVRHRNTGYDDLLMKGWDRDAARAVVKGELDDLIDRWAAPPAATDRATS